MQNNLTENLDNWNRISCYSTWMYHTYEKYVGKRVFDVGAGMGRMVSYYIDKCDNVVATDIFQNQVDYMNRRFENYPYFTAALYNILADELTEYRGRFDTVICINVLEHLENDEIAINRMKELLVEGGKIILIVPAFQKLYCQMDRNVGHYRRYDRGVLASLAEKCGMKILYRGYFNAMGIIPYYLKGRKTTSEGESFSTSLNENNSRLYNFASKVLEPIEKAIPPKFGISEVMVLEKRG